MEATATKVKAERARFEAPGQNFNVIIEHMKERFGENGLKQAVPNSGKVAQFTDVPGEQRSFYETEDPEVIQYLRIRANEFGHFYEVPIPKPDSAPVMRKIIGLAARGDKDALVALAAEEDETHGREDVLDAVADALEQIGA